jgi:hypothetical protein
MKRGEFVQVLGLASLALPFGRCGSSAQQAARDAGTSGADGSDTANAPDADAAVPAVDAGRARPNIVFIMADDHGSQAISAYGWLLNQTPHIDRIAREGVRFDNCFCTNALCAPSRAGILTGKRERVVSALFRASSRSIRPSPSKSAADRFDTGSVLPKVGKPSGNENSGCCEEAVVWATPIRRTARHRSPPPKYRTPEASHSCRVSANLLASRMRTFGVLPAISILLPCLAGSGCATSIGLMTVENRPTVVGTRPETQRVTINSEPAGATVIRDDMVAGTTPLAMDFVYEMQDRKETCWWLMPFGLVDVAAGGVGVWSAFKHFPDGDARKITAGLSVVYAAIGLIGVLSPVLGCPSERNPTPLPVPREYSLQLRQGQVERPLLLRVPLPNEKAEASVVFRQAGP